MIRKEKVLTTSSHIGYLLATPSENQFPVMGLSHNKTKMNIGKKLLPQLYIYKHIWQKFWWRNMALCCSNINCFPISC